MDDAIGQCEGPNDSAITVSMRRLDESICQNSEAVGELINRIGPVLLEETPVTKVCESKDPSAKCDVDDRLDSAIARINQITSQVRCALDRLQL